MLNWRRNSFLCFDEAFSLVYFHFSSPLIFLVIKCKFKALLILKRTSKWTNKVSMVRSSLLATALACLLSSQSRSSESTELGLFFLTSHLLCSPHWSDSALASSLKWPWHLPPWLPDYLINEHYPVVIFWHPWPFDSRFLPLKTTHSPSFPTF